MYYELMLYILLGGIIMFQWKEEYKLGVDFVDEQHKKIV
ncbi:hypothetical protein M918_12620 [Clostridium sp. BL8]|nr:hypothetical protein M918_12620 [Clostridium sp. BL8]